MCNKILEKQVTNLFKWTFAYNFKTFSSNHFLRFMYDYSISMQSIVNLFSLFKLPIKELPLPV